MIYTYRLLVVLCSILCFTSSVLSQSVNQKVKDVVMPAPNAAALGKYGDIPVSYYTGVPNIGIPITTVQEGPLSLSVGLSYHASGVKVGEMASWVGMGWALNAGGMISRTVQGLPDELGSTGYYATANELVGTSASSADNINMKTRLANSMIDGEPDLYSFTADGLSGKFYVDKDKIFRLVPLQDLKVQFVDETNRKEGFVITKPDGNRYIFGRLPGSTTTAQEFTSFGGNDVPTISSWYLLRVESHDKLYQINFSYSDETYSYKSLATCRDQQTTCTGGGNGAVGSGGYFCSTDDGYDATHHYITATITGKRLNKITTTSGTTVVSFRIRQLSDGKPDPDYIRQDLDQGSSTAKAAYLYAIEVGTGSTTYCKRFELSYDYFIDATSTSIAARSESKRLKLTQVQEMSCSKEATYDQLPTKFTYNGAVTNGKQFLPHRLSKAIDHWGFYNGQQINNTEPINVPTTTTNGVTFTSKVNRETDEAKLKLGTLERIDYPTGGNTQFVFEANTHDRLQDGAKVYKKLTSTSDALQTSTAPHDSINCGDRTVNSTAPHVTFATASEIVTASFKIYLTSAYQTRCENSTDKVVRMTVYNAATGAKIGNSYSFNQSNFPGQSAGNITKKFSEVNISLQSGVAYRFELYARNGMGKLEVFSVPKVSVIAKVGGLRVKSVKSNDGISVNNDIVKSYNYNLNSTSSSGQLLYLPQYGYYVTGEAWANDQPPYSYSAQVTATFFDEVSITPLSSFEGYHIGYSQVKETFTNNGYTLYTYDNPGDIVNNNNTVYPRPPYQIDVLRGIVKKEAKFSEAELEVASTSTTPVTPNYLNNAGYIVRVSPPFKCLSVFNQGGGSTTYSSATFFTRYSIRTAAYQLKSTTEVLNGVSTTTNYTYGGGSYLHPKSVATTNSDSKDTKTTYSYPYELATSAARTVLVDRYIVGIPVETKVTVGSTTVGGDKTVYSLFSRTTGLPVSSGTDVDVYPHKFYDYEMTWEGTTVKTGDYVLKGTVDSYYKTTEDGKGYPKQYTATNWPAETYDWKNGLIIKRTYKDYVWKYGYVSGTRLLSSITDIDLQTTSYTYDKLQRLKTISARNAAVVTTYDYHYTVSTVAEDKNYVKSSTTYTAVTGSNLTNQTSWQYLDGLGRPIQTVQQKAGPNSIGIATIIQYDNQGRTVRISNPFATADITGAFVAEPANTRYTLTGYEASPLSRVASVTPPDWYATTTTYGSNSSNDAVFKDNETDKYGSNLLYKTTVKDPAGNATITFTDKKGRVVLTRRASSTSATSGADTYSRYDDKDRVTMVTPPGTTASTENVVFRYTYDKANNLLTKKVPDANLVTYKYSTRDQPVLMQDGNLAVNSKWIASVYDDYGRVTATGNWIGTVPSPISPTDLTIKAADELTRTYYDGYDGSSQVDLAAKPQYRGKVRKSLAKVLDGSSTATWLYTTNTYDPQGRLTGTTGNNYQNASDASSEVMTLTYDWADNLLRQTRVHKPSSSVIRTLAYRNTYGGSGQRAGLYLKVDSGTEQLLANYTYNERDLLAQRNLHGVEVNGDDGHLQSLDYTYNAQGWLTRINQSGLTTSTGVGLKVSPTAPVAPNPATVAFSDDGPDGNDLFYLELKYDVLQSGLTGTVRKDGNIAQVIWRTRGRERQAYSATYDYLSRMSTASYYDITDGGVVSTDQKYKEEVTYADARGNIATLKRNGMYPDGAAWKVGQIDNLTYTSTSGTNRLASVTEAASTAAAKPFGFNPGAVGTGYTYDANGNLIKDTYKGITAITYNYLNLPGKISFSSSKSITFTYDATGRKLKKVTAGGSSAENYTQYYADGLEYRSTTLEAIYHEEGRLTPKTSTTWQYEYSIRDHLGNTRLTFADKNGDNKISVTTVASTNEVLQENHYTPFGLELGYAWMNDAAADSKYRFNGIERNEDFGVKLDMADFRSYDPAIGRWLQVDPMADAMPGMTPYRFGFNNPLQFDDPSGLFERKSVPGEETEREINGREIRIGYSQEESSQSSSSNSNNDFSWLVANSRSGSSSGGGCDGCPTYDLPTATVTAQAPAGYWRVNGRLMSEETMFMYARYNQAMVTRLLQEEFGTATAIKFMAFDVNSAIYDFANSYVNPVLLSITPLPVLGGLGRASTLARGSSTAFTGTPVTAGFGSGLKTATGGMKQWFRLGPSYSHTAGMNTQLSLRWGASPRYAHKIGNSTLRSMNQTFRQWKFPLPGRRFADPGHLHIRY